MVLTIHIEVNMILIRPMLARRLAHLPIAMTRDLNSLQLRINTSNIDGTGNGVCLNRRSQRGRADGSYQTRGGNVS